MLSQEVVMQSWKRIQKHGSDFTSWREMVDERSALTKNLNQSTSLRDKNLNWNLERFTKFSKLQPCFNLQTFILIKVKFFINNERQCQKHIVEIQKINMGDE